MNAIGNQNLYIKLNTLEKRIENLNEKFDNLNNKLDNLDNKLNKILKLLEDNSVDCKKMSSHIDFIDNIYENVKMPLNFVCDSINSKFIEK